MKEELKTVNEPNWYYNIPDFLKAGIVLEIPLAVPFTDSNGVQQNELRITTHEEFKKFKTTREFKTFEDGWQLDQHKKSSVQTKKFGGGRRRRSKTKKSRRKRGKSRRKSGKSRAKRRRTRR